MARRQNLKVPGVNTGDTFKFGLWPKKTKQKNQYFQARSQMKDQTSTKKKKTRTIIGTKNTAS
jgi:hypothetical protein